MLVQEYNACKKTWIFVFFLVWKYMFRSPHNMAIQTLSNRIISHENANPHSLYKCTGEEYVKKGSFGKGYFQGGAYKDFNNPILLQSCNAIRKSNIFLSKTWKKFIGLLLCRMTKNYKLNHNKFLPELEHTKFLIIVFEGGQTQQNYLQPIVWKN